MTSHVLDLAAHLRLRGHEADVAGPCGSGSLELPDYCYSLGGAHPLPSPGDSAKVNLNPFLPRKVRQLLSRKTYDVIHLHEPFLPFIGPAFLAEERATRVATFHTSRKTIHLPYFLGRPLIKGWNKRLHARIAVSDTARETAMRYVPGEFRVIPNGVDLSRFSAPANVPGHLADERPTVLYVGRLEARKGIHHLLNAFKLVKVQVPVARLVIVGDGTLLKQLQSQAQQLEMQDDVLFEGFVSLEDLPGYYQAASVFASPSTANESFGITLVEAMAAGTPAVATSINGAATLGDSSNGIVVPPADARSMAAGITTLLQAPELAAHMAESAQRYAQRYDWSTVTADLLRLYEESSSLGILANARF